MKHTVSTLALCAAFIGGPALAADLPSRKAPPPTYYEPTPVAAWTGFYVGVNAGGAFGGSSSANTSAYDLYDLPGAAPGAAFATSANSSAALSNSSFIGGGQVGYNWQFNNRFVAGLETDIQGVDGNTSALAGGVGYDPLSGATPITTTQVQKSLDYLGTVRGRLGFLATPSLLIYATGGLAYGGVNLQTSSSSVDAASVFAPGFGSGSVSNTQVGYTVGGGLEWMFAHNWSAKLEYLYYDLGSATASGAAVSGVNGAGATQWAYAPSTSARFDGHIVRAGLNYHFNWAAPAPVVAKD